MGTGDVAVAKKVRRAAAGLYERSRDYRQSLTATDPQELQRALARHVYGRDAVDRQSEVLAAYVRMAVGCLAGQEGEDVLEGRITFPVPIRAEDAG
jgi:cytochrome b pre-mRNA-processing protein 3